MLASDFRGHRRHRHQHRPCHRRTARWRRVADEAGSGSEGSQASGAGGAYHPPACRRCCACRATRPRRTEPRTNDAARSSARPTPPPPSAPIRRPCAWATPSICRARSRSTRPPCSWSAATSTPRSRRVFDNLKAVATAAGGTLDDAREGHRVPHRSGALRARERDHGHVFPAALPGPRRRGRCRAAARRARGDGVHP